MCDVEENLLNLSRDFENKEEAHEIYFQAKQGIVKGDCYV